MMIFRKLLLTITVVFGLYEVYAQETSDCFTKHQLTKMQSAELGDIRSFLNGAGWQFSNAQNDQLYEYFGVRLKYDAVQWEKQGHYLEGVLMLLTSPIHKSIIVFQTNSNCFSKLIKEFESKENTTKIEHNILITTFKLGNLSIEFREYENDYSSRQYSILIYDRANLNQQTNEALENRLKYEKALNKADLLFEQGQFEQARVLFSSAYEIEPSEEIELKIETCLLGIIRKHIIKGDSLILLQDFSGANKSYKMALEIGADRNLITSKFRQVEEALVDMLLSQARHYYSSEMFDSSQLYYQRVLQIDESNTAAVSGVRNIKREIKRRKIALLTNTADKYFAVEKFDSAKIYYRKILSEDAQNKIANKKLLQIEQIEEIIEQRSHIVFSYKNINPISYKLFKTDLENRVNEIIKENKKGYINADFNILFDTSGVNNSKVTTCSTSSQGFNEFLEQELKKSKLTPSKKMSYFISSKENINFITHWESDKISIKFTSDGFQGLSTDAQIDYPIMSFVNSQSFKYGKYTYLIKRKNFNETIYNDISLHNYKVVGPGAAIYSMLLPGLGTLKVSYGEKGKGRLTTFLIGAIVAGSAKLYSDQQYSKYETATQQSAIDDYYVKANNAHKVALISAGISASIYLYDIGWVLSKGTKNRKQSRQLRNSLNGPKPIIQSEKVKF